MIGFYIILSSSLNFINRTGELTLATASFTGIGAYTSTLLTLKLHFPFIIAFLLSGFCAGVIALVLGRITLRLKAVYFVLVTFAFNEVMRLIFTAWVSFFWGANGIGNIPAPQINLLLFNLVLDTKAKYYFLTYFVTLGSVLLLVSLLRSPMGNTFKNIRSSDLLAQSVGTDIMKYKVISFVVGCTLVGFGGSLFAHYFRFISPYSFTFWLSVNAVMINVIGGFGSIRGCILGSVIFSILVEAVRVGQQFELMIYGALIILTVLFCPGGVDNLLQRLWERKSKEVASAESGRIAS
jgi:branched-chain amino acid transport system permease protein